MKPIVIIILCAAGLAACAPTSATVGPISSGSGTAASVVKIAQATCQFVPTASTIAGILTTSPGLNTAQAIAEAICAAVAPLASGPGLEGVRQGYVGPVKVRGRYTG
jgi:hypothetical protein